MSYFFIILNLYIITYNITMNIYIDLNLLSDFEKEINIYNLILESHKKNTNYFYSPAHLYDLDSAGLKDNDPQKRIDKLLYLQNIVFDNYLFFNKKLNKISKSNTSPNIFTSNKYSNGYAQKKLSNILSNRDSIIELQGLLNSNIPIDILEKNIKNRMNDEDYKKERRILLDNKKYRIKLNNFKFHIQDRLKMLKKEKSLFDIIEFSYDDMDYIEDIEIIIKEILINKELSVKKLKFIDNVKNTDSDFMHCFFATYCDYFVTRDRILFAKSSFIYKFLNEEMKIDIRTKVITLDEFLELIK